MRERGQRTRSSDYAAASLLSGSLAAQCLSDLFLDFVRRRLRIVRGTNGTPYHQVILTGCDRLQRRHESLMVVGAAAREPDSRRHDQQLRIFAAQPADRAARCDDAIAAPIDDAFCPVDHLIVDRKLVGARPAIELLEQIAAVPAG